MIGLITAPALAGVWTAQPSSGDSGKGCYLVKFNAGQQLMGNGVVSGNTFSGFLRGTPNPQYQGTTMLSDCGSDAYCAWNYSYNVVNGVYISRYVVSVSGMPINSATPIGCY